MTTADADADAVATTRARMTERSSAQTRPRRAARRPGPGGVLAGSAAGFFALLAFLAFQLAGGRDPALGAGEAAAPKPARQVVVRKIRRRVVVPPSAGAAISPRPAAPAGTGSAPTAASSSAPAPAPAPAPVTRSS
jgi:hypothetical protein